MLAIKLAFRNLIGAGLRTWLNVSVLSLAFVVIVFYNGLLDGWNQQARSDTRAWSVGNGQLWHPSYDPYDFYSLQDAHAPISPEVSRLVSAKQITPILITQASIFPKGRSANILLKGINPAQHIIQMPSYSLKSSDEAIPAIIGKRMATANHLKKGDKILLQWRDKNGTFDAKEIQIKDIFKSNVPLTDQSQVWVSLSDLQQMTGFSNEATLFIAGESYHGGNIGIWQFKNLDFLLSDIDEVISAKRGGSFIIYGLLLAIALLAIFDAQVLSVFRRQKEIGTYIALGMTRWKVIKIFTFEGAAHSVLAIILGTLWGIPLLAWLQSTGIPMPQVLDTTGLAISDKIIPVYSMTLILLSVVLVVVSATIVSYFPTRRIAKMKPTDALKGKIQ